MLMKCIKKLGKTCKNSKRSYRQTPCKQLIQTWINKRLRLNLDLGKRGFNVYGKLFWKTTKERYCAKCIREKLNTKSCSIILIFTITCQKKSKFKLMRLFAISNKQEKGSPKLFRCTINKQTSNSHSLRSTA